VQFYSCGKFHTILLAVWLTAYEQIMFYMWITSSANELDDVVYNSCLCHYILTERTIRGFWKKAFFHCSFETTQQIGIYRVGWKIEKNLMQSHTMTAWNFWLNALSEVWYKLTINAKVNLSHNLIIKQVAFLH